MGVGGRGGGSMVEKGLGVVVRGLRRQVPPGLPLEPPLGPLATLVI